MKKKLKRILTIIILLLFIIWIIISWYLYSIWFDFKSYFLNLNISIYYKLLIILIFFIFRNFLFIPSTIIIILAWIILKNFYLTTIISLIWVSIWLIQTYMIWYLFAEDLKKSKFKKQIEKYNNEINEKWTKVIFLWSMFPALPTDIICYAAWFVKFNIFKFYVAWILWELPIILLYCYIWIQAEKYMWFFIYFIMTFFILYLFNLIFKKQINKVKAKIFKYF